MAAVSENQVKHGRGRHARQMNGHRTPVKHCSACRNETRWLSVDGMCWDCTIQVAKNKIPFFLEVQEEEGEGSEQEGDLFGSI